MMDIQDLNVLDQLKEMGLDFNCVGGSYDDSFANTSVSYDGKDYEMISQNGDIIHFRNIFCFLAALEKTQKSMNVKLFVEI